MYDKSWVVAQLPPDAFFFPAPQTGGLYAEPFRTGEALITNEAYAHDCYKGVGERTFVAILRQSPSCVVSECSTSPHGWPLGARSAELLVIVIGPGRFSLDSSLPSDYFRYG